jgi:replicative DNA helicase
MKIETLDQQVADLRKYAANPEQRIRTGYDSLDFYVEGVAAGEVFNFAGRSYTGKSLIATDIMRMHPKHGSIFFSLEMSKRMALTRLFTQWADFDADRVRAAISANELPDLIDQMAEEMSKHIIVDKTNLSVADMMVYITEYSNYFGAKPDFVQIDYLERIGGIKSNADGWQAVEAAADQVKNMARALEIPVFLYHQTNRTEPPGDPVTDKSLRGGGFTEADQVVGIWAPARDPKMDESERRALWDVVQMNVIKNRPIGKQNEPWQPLEFRRTHSLRFQDMSDPGRYEKVAPKANVQTAFDEVLEGGWFEEGVGPRALEAQW